MTRRIINTLSSADPVLGRVIAAAGRYTLKPDSLRSPFQHLARAIAHQQLNGTAANTILRRFVALFHDDAEKFPTPEQILASDESAVRGAGFSFAKIRALKDLAQKKLDGVVPEAEELHKLTDAEIIERLTAVRGIGPWTVKMMLMFQLGRPDVMPADDFGVPHGFKVAYGLRELPPIKALDAFAERWAPYRSAAAWYLWRAVDLHKEGKLPKPPAARPKMPRVKPRRKNATKPVSKRALHQSRADRKPHRQPRSRNPR